jgi:hypothetical protein
MFPNLGDLPVSIEAIGHRWMKRHISYNRRVQSTGRLENCTSSRLVKRTMESGPPDGEDGSLLPL